MTEHVQHISVGKRIARISGKILLWIVALLLLLFLAVWALLKVPKVQNFAVHRATHYVSDKTHTRVELGEIDLGFPKYLILRNLFLEDQKHDTLLAASKVSIDIDMFALFKKKITIDECHLEHVVANISKSKNNQFNFQFLADAFASKDKDTVVAKDTTGTPWEIQANQIELSQCKFNFADSVSGMFLSSDFQNVAVDIDNLDLNKKAIDIEDVLLSGIDISLLQTLPATPDTSQGGGGWDLIGIQNLKIENTAFEYKDTYLKTRYYVNIGKSHMENGKVSLTAQTISLEEFFLGQSVAEILLKKDTTPVEKIAKEAEKIADKGWTLAAEEIVLENNTVSMDNQLPQQTKGIDYNHLALNGIGAAIEDVYYQGDKIQAKVANLKFQEKSGIGIRSFEGLFAMDKNFMKLTDFELNTNFSHIEKSVVLSYSSLAELQKSGNLSVNLPKSNIALQEVLWLVPSLEKNEIIAKNKNRNIHFDINATSNMADLKLKKLIVHTADTTYISVEGQLLQVTDPNKLAMDLKINEIVSSAKDLRAMLPDKMLPSSIAIPAQIALSGSHKGSLTDFATQLALISSSGNAEVTATIGQLKSQMPTYDVSLKTPGLALGNILKQNTLGSLVGTVHAKGTGFDKNKAVATVNVDIQKIGLNNYNYRNIKADAQIHQGLADIVASISDTNLAFKLDGTVGFVPSKEYYKLNLNLLGADLYRLGLYDTQMQLSAQLSTDIKGGNVKNINGSANLRNIVIVRDNKEYKIDSLMVASVNQPNKNSTTITSTLLTAQFNGNIDLLSVAPAITEHIKKYFNQEQEVPKSKTAQINPTKNALAQNFDFVLKLNESPIIKEVFLPSLTAYESISITGGFKGEASKLWMNLDLPSATYANNTVKNLTFAFDSDPTKASYNLQLASLTAGDIKLYKTALAGDIANNKIGINLTVDDSLAASKLKLQSQLITSGKNLKYSILPEGLQLKQQEWEVNPNNFIEFGKKHLKIEQFQISHKGQSLAVQSSSDLQSIKADIKNFNLRTISQIVEKNDSIFRGVINGQVDLQEFQSDKPRFTSNIKLTDLAYKTSKVGDIAIKADNHTAQQYNINADISGMGNDIALSGFYNAASKEQALNFILDIKTLKLASFDSFSGGQISESSGGLTGKLSISGATQTPIVEGKVRFVEAKTKVAFLNEALYMKEEVLAFSSKGITFESFVIRDEANNTAKIQGDVLMKAFQDIKFNLNVSTRNFTVLNTSAIQNKNYYGRLILDSDIRIQGTPDLPKINAIVNLAKGSKFTVAVPESKINVDKGDGVVLFLRDANDQHPIMLRRDDLEEKAAALKGMDLDAKIRIHPHTPLKLLIDPYTGDSLVVKGKADMNFAMDPSGKMSLSGIYTLSSGSYKAYIEGVIPKGFDLVKGGRIIWNGDPLDAQVDLSARYNIRTTAAELMTIGGGSGFLGDSSELSRPLMFEVYLIMQGELLKPRISFRLDMPENQRSAGKGGVYSKVNELNQDENELNKQVFSLLVLNKFLPATQTNTGGGGVSGFARSSVSKLMSDQLNQLSGQYLKGVELNFDVQSYNYNQGGKEQANTQVNVGLKKDFDRLSVQVGGNVPVEGKSQQSNTQNITGDVQVGYKLTKDGRYKLKAFRQNQVDNVANGVVTETGAGVLYSRDYNKTKDLFHFLRRKKKKK